MTASTAVSGKATQDSIAARLVGRDNALNALRLVLATFVVVDHSFKASTGRPGPLPYLGGFAVDGFFAISGYLIAGSRSRMSMRPFLWRRALRIMPAYWALLLFTALIVAPFAALVRSLAYDWRSGFEYILWNAALFTLQPDIGGGPTDVPYFGLWNAATWSLPYEAAAYVIFGLLVAFPGFSWRIAAGFSATLAVCVLLQHQLGLGAHIAPELTRLWSFFAAGVLLWTVRERLPSAVTVAALACGVLIVALLLGHGWYMAIAPVPAAFLLLWLGSTLPLRIGVKNDISYGVYLFAFPLQQLMVVAGVATAIGNLWFVLLSVTVAVPVAWASWLVVERPAMRLRRLIPAGSSPDSVPAQEPVP